MEECLVDSHMQDLNYHANYENLACVGVSFFHRDVSSDSSPTLSSLQGGLVAEWSRQIP